MALTILRCGLEGGSRWGVVDGPTARLLPTEVGATTARLFAHAPAALRQMSAGPARAIADLRLLTPVVGARQIVCQGLNYADHATESGHGRRARNLFFPKAASSLSGPFDDVIRPRGCRLLDYEVELGIVLKRDLDQDSIVTAANVGQWVGAFVLCNEMSARDLMFGAPFLQWFHGKSGRTFCPAGPYLLLPEDGEASSILETLELKLWLNGELRQSARTDDLIFKPAESLAEIASFMDMASGDLLLTGTPGGILAQGTPEIIAILKEELISDDIRLERFVEAMTRKTKFLAPGDRISATISSPDGSYHLGVQSFGVVDG